MWNLLPSIEGGLMKGLRKPIRITVTQDSDGRPVTFSSRRGTEKVSLVRRKWSFSVDHGRWKEMLKEFFLIETVRGTTCQICRDPATDTWYLQEMWD